MTLAPLTALAVHILQPHPCHQQAHQGHGNELHHGLSGSGLSGTIATSLVKLSALLWPILQCPRIYQERWDFPGPGAEVGKSPGGEVVTYVQ